MSYVKITCKNCHHQYFTDKTLSNCPECNQLNTNNDGGIFAFLLLAAICLAIATLLGGLFALLFYAFFWLFGMNRKWRAIVGVTLGVCIGLMTIYIIMFESGLNSEEVLPMIIIALLGGGSYYYLYKQVKKQPDFVDASDNAKRWRRIIWVILVLGTLAGVAAYYISENRERNNQVHPPSSDDRSQLNGGTEQYNLDESRHNEKADDQRVEEAPAANEMDAAEPAAAEGMIVKSGIATVNVERAYFYKEDKITRRKAYLLRNEVARFSDGDNDFIFVSFTNDQGVVTEGWMLRSDFKDIRETE